MCRNQRATGHDPKHRERRPGIPVGNEYDGLALGGRYWCSPDRLSGPDREWRSRHHRIVVGKRESYYLPARLHTTARSAPLESRVVLPCSALIGSLPRARSFGSSEDTGVTIRCWLVTLYSPSRGARVYTRSIATLAVVAAAAFNGW